jgi:hypothetical protein
MPRPKKKSVATSVALGPVVTGERLGLLERQRTELLRKVTQKKKSVESLERRVSEAEEVVARRFSPIHARFDQVNRELYSLLERLLDGGLNKRAHREVREVFRMLLDEGLVSVPEEDVERSSPFGRDEEDEDGEDRHAGSAGRTRTGEGGRANSDTAEAEGASGANSFANRESLKPLFRRLALALHPDRVQDEGEKEERTRLLKRIVHAYERGDVATLLQTEKAWLEERKVEALNEAAQCTALERLIVQLHEQLVDLRRAARRLRESDALHLVEVPAGARQRQGSDLERMAGRMEHDLEQISELRDFVREFAERRLTLEQFSIGPDLEFGGEVFDFEDLRERAFHREEPRPQRRRGATRSRRR